MFLKLIVQQQLSHPTRFIATIFALACSVSATVWIVGGYERLFSQTDENAERYLGRFHALLTPGTLPAGAREKGAHQKINGARTTSRATSRAPAEKRKPIRNGEPPSFLPRPLIETLKTMPQVQELVLSQSTRISVSSEDSQPSSIEKLVKDRAPVFGAPPLDPLLVTSEAPTPLYALNVGRWLDGKDVVISQSVADSLRVELGDVIRITSLKHQTSWKVGGIVTPPEDSPAFPSLAILSTNAVYVTPEQHQAITGEAFTPSHAHLLFAKHSDEKNALPEAIDQARKSIQEIESGFALLDDATVAQGLAQSRKLKNSKGEAWSVALLASLASVIVIGAIMSDNVRERSRELAMLRAIGWTRGELSLSLLLEAMLFALLGWAVGIIAGHWMVQLLVPGAARQFTVLPGGLTLTSSFVCVTTGALSASIVPILRAMRLAPIDAMQQNQTNEKKPSLSGLAVLGILFLIIGLLANSPLAANRSHQLTWIHRAAYPCLLAGFACFLPLFTQALVRIVAPGLANLFRIDLRLLVDSLRLRSTMWASLAFALSIGLSILLATQIWGHSMLQTFLPGKWIPDVLIALNLNEKESAQVSSRLWDDLKSLPEVQTNTVTPLYVEQARIAWTSGESQRGLGADNAVILGLDPGQAFSGHSPLLQFEWLSGTPETTIEQMASNNGCVVSEDFCIRNNLELGDELTFEDPNQQDTAARLKIAGVVRMTGWHWLTKFSGLRKRYVRTGALIFADAHVVKQSFALPSPEFCWINTIPGVDLNALEQIITNQAVGHLRMGSDASGSPERDLFLEPTVVNEAAAPWLRFTARDWIDESIRIRSDQYLWGMCYLPLYTMLLFACAVACKLFSFVKQRSWEMGVVRSLGFSRWFLVRWIAAEGLFLAIIVAVTSLIFGMVAGWGGLSLARYEGFFAGPAPWVLPQREVMIGMLMAVGLCGLSTLWPAWHVGTKPLLNLLQKKD